MSDSVSQFGVCWRPAPIWRAVVPAAWLLVCACGGVDPKGQDSEEPEPSGQAGNGSEPEPEPSPTGPTPEAPAPYLPMSTGVRWTYQVTDNGVVTRKVTTVGPLEAVGGTGPNQDVMAYRVTTEKNDGVDETVSWQNRVGDLAVRYREQSFGPSGLELEEHWEPYKLRLDETDARLEAGQSWQERYSETKLAVNQAPVTANRTEQWVIVALDESVTVPAGTYDCLVVEKTSTSSTKRYWFARGVGKVKETGGQTEELVSVELP